MNKTALDVTGHSAARPAPEHTRVTRFPTKMSLTA